MIHYTVPSPYGVLTRSSASHTLAGKRYRWVVVHVWIKAGELVDVTWHTRRDLALKATTDRARPGDTRQGAAIEITDAMCREPKIRASLVKEGCEVIDDIMAGKY